MPRIRTIKPEFWSNEALSTISEPAILLAIALLNYADDEGYFNANEKLIRAFAFPIREPSTTIRRAIDELSSIGYIMVREAENGRSIGLIVSFAKHQRIDRGRPSTLRQFYDASSSPRRALAAGMEWNGMDREHDGNSTPDADGVAVQLPSHVDAQAQDAHARDSDAQRPEQKRRTGKRAPGDQPFEADFDVFWAAYPRRVDKGRARKTYAARRRDGSETAALLAAAGHYADECRRESRDPKYILHASTFLGPSGRWEEFVTAPEPEEAPRQAPELEPGEWIPGYKTPEPERVLTPEDIAAREVVYARMREKARTLQVERMRS